MLIVLDFFVVEFVVDFDVFFHFFVRILGLEEDFGYHSVICMVLFMGTIFCAIAKNDPHAHDKVEFKFKKR